MGKFDWLDDMVKKPIATEENLVTSYTQRKTALQLGVRETPLEWAKFLVEKSRIVDVWMEGGTIYDPCFGYLTMFQALMECALEKGHSIEDMQFENLHGNELNSLMYETAFTEKKGHDIIKYLKKENFTNKDFLDVSPYYKYDAMLSFLPNIDYRACPKWYNDLIIHKYIDYGLTNTTRNIFFHKMIISYAGLLLNKMIADNLKEGGVATTFLNMNVYTVDAAHNYFRKSKAKGVDYALKFIIDMKGTPMAKYYEEDLVLVKYQRDEKTQFPVPTTYYNRYNWFGRYAAPLFGNDNVLTFSDNLKLLKESVGDRLLVRKISKPRQGVNTFGGTKYYLFDYYEELGDGNAVIANEDVGRITVPQKYVYPIITNSMLTGNADKTPTRWILLPYNEVSGKPLNVGSMKKEPLLYEYFKKYQTELENRKTLTYQPYIKHGIFWAVFALGDYSFKEHKVVWLTSKTKKTVAQIFKGRWIPYSTSMVSMTTYNEEDAVEICNYINSDMVDKYLNSLNLKRSNSSYGKVTDIAKMLEFYDAEEEAASQD